MMDRFWVVMGMLFLIGSAINSLLVSPREEHWRHRGTVILLLWAIASLLLAIASHLILGEVAP